MKKLVFVIILVLFSFYIVDAKDISYSMNKYSDEIFNYIEKAYDKDSKEDGYVLGGSVFKDDVDKNDHEGDYQVILVKYDKNDKLVWKYVYGDSSDDYIDYLTYTYDENGNIDGYLIVTKKTYNIFDGPHGTTSGMLIKIDFDGKSVFEKEITNSAIKKIIPTYDDNGIDGYVSIMNTQTGSSLVKYNKNFDIVFKKDFNDTDLSDLTIIKEEGKIIGYAVIEGNNLMTVDLNGTNDVVLDTIDKYDKTKLVEADNGFLVYGITSEVKLDKGESSYYIINYKNGEEVWETIGTTAATKDEEIVLLPIYKDNKIKEYFLLYKNEVDSSYEVVKINLDGEVLKKIKKINNNYYIFKNFYSTGSTIYFIGQIDCPEDESCEYDNNSLYLVSDEDKVIEVEDNTSNGIIVVFTIIIIVLIGGIIFIKKKTSK